MSGCFAGADRADIECGNSQLVARVKLSAVRRLPRVSDLRKQLCRRRLLAGCGCTRTSAVRRVNANDRFQAARLKREAP